MDEPRLTGANIGNKQLVLRSQDR